MRGAPLTWLQRVVLMRLSDPGGPGGRVLMAVDHTSDPQFRLFPGAKVIDRRTVKMLRGWGYITEVYKGPAGLPCYTVTEAGIRGLEQNERPYP